jgi:endonuclease YncB( thermonuclease family)
MLMRLIKTPWQQCSGVFLWPLFVLACLWPGFAAAADAVVANCPAQSPLRWYKLSSIYDGDTLRLRGGEKVRVLAINSPELASEKNATQPLAAAARQAARDFFASSVEVGLEAGAEQRDRYGRLLAHVYRRDGVSLSAAMLSQGLAWQVVVPPNDAHWQCLQALERQARKQRLGVWQAGVYPIRQAGQLTTADAGFQRVQGVVSAVSRDRGGWWLQMGRLAIRIKNEDLANFDGLDPAQLQSRHITVRGWLIDRSRSSAVKKRGFSPLMLPLRHPAMLN